MEVRDLIKKGFKLNKYEQGNYYEFSTTNEDIISNILKEEYWGDEETLVFQIKEDFSELKMCIDAEVWEINDVNMNNYLERF